MENLTFRWVHDQQGSQRSQDTQPRDVGMGIVSILWFPFLTYRHLLRLACNVSILTHCEDSHLSTSKMYIFLLFITYSPRLLRYLWYWSTIPASYRISSKDPATYIKKTACFGLSGRSCTYILRYMKPHRVGKPCEGGHPIEDREEEKYTGQTVLEGEVCLSPGWTCTGRAKLHWWQNKANT